jgi:hypothetical protein
MTLARLMRNKMSYIQPQIVQFTIIHLWKKSGITENFFIDKDWLRRRQGPRGPSL